MQELYSLEHAETITFNYYSIVNL